MFSLLRLILVIGVIFYFSPVRQGKDGAWTVDGVMAMTKSQTALLPSPSDVPPQRLESLWNALPESAKQAVIGKILPQPSTQEARRTPPQTDTLQPEDHRPAWSGITKKPGA